MKINWGEGRVKSSPNHASTNLHLPTVHPQHRDDCCITHGLHSVFKKYFICTILMHIVEFHMINFNFHMKHLSIWNSENEMIFGYFLLKTFSFEKDWCTLFYFTWKYPVLIKNTDDEITTCPSVIDHHRVTPAYAVHTKTKQ